MKSLGAGATPLDFAYEVHTDVGHRCVGAKVNGKIVPLHYELQSGDIVEVLTSKRERGPSRDWLAVVKTTRARNKIRAWFKAESREDSEHTGPRAAAGAPQEGGPARAEDHRLGPAGGRDPRDGLPQGRRLLHRARRGQDLAQGRRQQGHAAPEGGRGGRRGADGRRGPRLRAQGAAAARGRRVEVRHPGRGRRGRPAAAGQVLPPGLGRPDPRLRLARPRHHDPPRGLPERRRRCARTRSGSSRSAGTATPPPPSRSSCRSTAGTATACSRTSRGRSPRPASTSSRRAASSRTRWSRTASWSRSATRRRSSPRSRACARSRPSSTPTASRPAGG